MSVEATTRSVVYSRRSLNTVGDEIGKSDISLPRISCVHGEFTPPIVPNRPVKKQKPVVVENSAPPVDWIGRPMGRKFGALVKSKPYVPPLPPTKGPRDWLEVASITSPNDVLEVVARTAKMAVRSIIGRSRCQDVVHWRMVCAHILDARFGLSDTQIGEVLHRERTTILHSLRKVTDHPEQFSADIKRVEALL